MEVFIVYPICESGGGEDVESQEADQAWPQHTPFNLSICERSDGGVGKVDDVGSVGKVVEVDDAPDDVGGVDNFEDIGSAGGVVVYLKYKTAATKQAAWFWTISPKKSTPPASNGCLR